MKEELIALAKEKGFKSDFILGINKKDNESIYYFWCCELQEWLRDNHGVFIIVNTCGSDDTCWYEIYYGHKGEYSIIQGKDDNSFNKALEDGLIKALKVVKIR